MIEYISGKIVSNRNTEIILETNGFGYNIKVSLNTAQKLPAPGAQATLKTYLHVRENGIQLYGFADEQERELFMGLLSISGVGPKLALTLLSGLTVEQVQRAVYAQDVKTLSSISGIGKKTAQRLIVELKDKITLPEGVEAEKNAALLSEPKSEAESEAILALVSLGYSKIQAVKAVSKVQNINHSEKSEEIIKRALQVI
ncbi:Holliday junction branch migration protein RuvA [Caldithrix abyssi]|uniref:Holliday junction branch migration complex subunit RuvA n=1 Tax=Caldithrix abyssi DSM 13497 TaxID=880073 RepID=H1XP85_CALAY|nr:Holliday junction branch migration protein RuvA [Caldithrix abyssi]APF18172.1 ruvA Holliday junction DNA helicase subunit RuvA [Caldithrix abyssi DSM 13497]EHO42200.1 Holliday junction ATP-dependent DNA helicase ruvA [Caldithrix abyssi DSM 13497]